MDCEKNYCEKELDGWRCKAPPKTPELCNWHLKKLHSNDIACIHTEGIYCTSPSAQYWKEHEQELL